MTITLPDLRTLHINISQKNALSMKHVFSLKKKKSLWGRGSVFCTTQTFVRDPMFIFSYVCQDINKVSLCQIAENSQYTVMIYVNAKTIGALKTWIRQSKYCRVWSKINVFMSLLYLILSITIFSVLSMTFTLTFRFSKWQQLSCWENLQKSLGGRGSVCFTAQNFVRDYMFIFCICVKISINLICGK